MRHTWAASPEANAKKLKNFEVRTATRAGGHKCILSKRTKCDGVIHLNDDYRQANGGNRMAHEACIQMLCSHKIKEPVQNEVIPTHVRTQVIGVPEPDELVNLKMENEKLRAFKEGAMMIVNLINQGGHNLTSLST